MAKRSLNNSEDKRVDSPGGDASEPRLFLKRPPLNEFSSQEEFDEMIPEFMHRDFYRSKEDEFSAIEPLRVKPVKPEKLAREKLPTPSSLAPLREAQLDPAPEAIRPLPPPPPLAPLRGGAIGGRDSDTVELESRDKDMPKRAESSSFLKPVNTANLNLPLVACLLFLVGLFLWREQTRPEHEQALTLPSPNVVQATPATVQASVLQNESPYPEMSPRLAAPGESAEQEGTAQLGSEQTEVADAAAMEERTETEEPDAQGSFPSEDPSAQRAAILERMSEGAVSRNERERRLEGSAVPPADDASLFPDMEEPRPKARPPVATAPKAAPKATAPVQAQPKAVVALPDSSLFPESVEPARPQAAVPQQAPARPQAAVPQQAPLRAPVTPPSSSNQGDAYQIAEPDL